jgi:hypothetical protein
MGLNDAPGSALPEKACLRQAFFFCSSPSPLAQQQAELASDHLAYCKEVYERNGAERANLAYGYALNSA